MKNKLILPTIALLGVFLFIFIFRTLPQTQDKKFITVGKVKLSVEIADTDVAKTKGLSGRTSLPRDQGMLFVFSQKSPYSFWMKDMKFPLDFIWIDGDKVVDLTKNVPAPKENEPLSLITPKAPVDKVLEVNAGVIDSSGIKIGDLITGF